MTEIQGTDLAALHQKMDAVLRWQAVHDESHKAIDTDVREVRAEVYDKGGLKDIVRTVYERCKQRACTSKVGEFLFGAGQQVLANGGLAFVLWLLFIYKAH
jgi:hypothetical protein